MFSDIEDLSIPMHVENASTQHNRNYDLVLIIVLSFIPVEEPVEALAPAAIAELSSDDEGLATADAEAVVDDDEARLVYEELAGM